MGILSKLRETKDPEVFSKRLNVITGHTFYCLRPLIKLM